MIQIVKGRIEANEPDILVDAPYEDHAEAMERLDWLQRNEYDKMDYDYSYIYVN